MNSLIEKINEENVLFFDIETASKFPSLEEDSRDFELFQKKCKNKDSDDYPDFFETNEMYKKWAPLRLTYNKIVSIGVGMIVKGKPCIKVLTGQEEDILREFAKITSKFEYLCGVNILKFDLPIISVQSSKYFRLSEIMPDKFIVSNKKPWQLDKVVDLLDVFQGTNMMFAPSLDEMCNHFGISSPKEDFDGGEVSVEFHTNGIEKIVEYSKADLKATINLFKAIRFEERFSDDDFQIRGDEQPTTDTKEESLLEVIRRTGIISKDQKAQLTAMFTGVAESEVRQGADLVKAAYLTIKGKKAENQAKEQEVDELFTNIIKSNGGK